MLGFNGATQELIDLCNENNIILLEDCCESHGANFNGTKVGNIGIAGTFSFYYGHHMTTIEGGMISTNNEELYHQLVLNRSHGFLREHPNKDNIKYEVEFLQKDICDVTPEDLGEYEYIINLDFIFLSVLYI